MVTTISVLLALVIIAIIIVGIKTSNKSKSLTIVYIILGVALLVGLYFAWSFLYFAENWG